MATIILDSAASNTAFADGTTELTPQDGDIYILQSDAVNEFRFLGDADFEVRIEDAGPYSQGTGQVTLSFEDTTNPTVIYANGVDAQRVGLNANGDSLTVNAGDNVTLGPIIGSGEEKIPSMPSGDGLNADGGGLTITTGSGTTVTSTIDGPSSGADANYTFGEGNEFWTGATVTGSVGGNTTIVVGDNAVVSAGAGFVAPLGDLNGNTQSITIGNNVVHDPSTNEPAWEITVAGTNGEKIIDIGDNVTVGEVGFGSEGTASNFTGFDNNTTFVNPTGGTLTAGENLTVTEFIWGTEGGSTYILGDGWDVPFDLSGAGENNGDDPADKLILGEPAIQGGDTGVLIGSGNDQISIMPPTSSPAERSEFIDSATAAQWAENDDGSWSPTIANSNDLVYDMGIYTFGAGSPGPAPNQIVDGENDAEFMGDGYDDANGPTNSGGDIIDGADGDNDVILGNGGNDTINAGAGTDEVYGGSGNDVIDGGAGNDTLTGDFASDVTDTVVDNSTVEGDDILEGGAGDDVIYGDSGNSLSAGGEGVPGDTLGDGPGSTGGGYDRVSAQSVYNGNHTFSTDAFYLGNDIPVLDDANRDAITGVSFSQDGEGTDRTFGLDELTFTGAQRSFVGLVTVQDSDVHNANDQFSSSISGGFQDTTVVSSGTADFTMNDGQVFQGIRVNFVRGPDGETYMVPDDGPTPGGFNAFRNMLATNDSGIASFEIATGSGDDAGINPIEGNWADGQFFELTEGDGGDDTIIGGEGADQMFGEGGDDTFIVGSAAEGAGDVISGGNGPDETTDNDVLDLTGAGPVTINATPDANDAGAQSGTVTFADGSTLTFEGIETIIQDPDNTAPTANDDVTNTAEGAAVQVNVLANDTDPEGGDLDILGTPTAANGTVEVNNETGEITYTPDPGFVGTDTITYTTVDEGGLTDTATLTVNVAAQPDSGPDAIDDSITVFESEGAGDTDGNVLTNDLQEAGEPGPYTGGVVEVNGATGNVGEWIDLPEGGRVLINSDGSVDFDANGDFEELSGGESENITIDYCIQTTSAASTGANPGEGPTINVGTTLTNLVTIGGTGAETFAVGGDGDLIGGTAISVTGNLLPPLFFGNDNDTLDISGAVAQGWTPTELIRLPDQPLIGNGFSGSFLLTKDGELPVTVTYLEIENFVGFDNVTEKDAATLTVTVQGEDDAPVIDPIDDTSIDENSTAPVFTPTATDPDGDPVTYSLTGDDADLFDIDPDTGEVTPVAPLDFENPTDANGDGIYDITVVATDPDGLTDEEPVAITVDDVNEAPVLEDIGPQTAPENSTDPVFTANATDPDGDQPVYSLTGPDADLFDIDPDTGEVTPVAPLDADNPTDANGDGVYDVTVVATDPNDPALRDEEDVSITIGDVNEAPVIDDIGPQTTPENATDPVFTPTATDPDGDPVTYSLTGDDADLFDIDPDTGEVTPVAPLDFENPTDANGDGIYDITVVATDPDGLTDEEPVAITVDDVNEAPVLEDIGPQTAPENSTDPVFTANATDPDGDQPVYSLTGPDADLFDIDPDTGEVTPVAPLDADNPTDANGDGVYDVTVVATDPNDPALRDEEDVSITIGDVNEAPVIDDIGPQTTPENATDPVFTPTATDPDGDPVTYSLTGDDADLFDIDPDTGEVTPVAPLDFENPTDANGDGIYDITVVATDPDGLTDEEPVAITVDDVNEAPDAIDDRAETDFNTPVTIDVLVNDTDAESDTLTIINPTVPANQGTVSVVNGALLFTPADGFEGDATISYTVSDGDLTDTAEVVVTVGDNPADGVVDGAEDGEVMDPGYTDPQGDEIDGADGLDDTINGNGGDDDIDAGLGDDSVSGGEGNDTIDGNDGDDTIDGNEGEDTIDGGDGDDVIDGGDDDDSITGGDGNDTVEGGNGNDVIDTSGPVDPNNGIGSPDIGYPGVFPGDNDPLNDLDTVFGGAGNDVISTGDDADSIDGGTGDDTIDGGIDADTIDGGDGDDRIVGGEGADSIEGGDGNDTIFAGNDPDLGLDQFNIEDDGTNPLGPDLAPDNGDDLVFGGAGNDTIFGADDSDELFGGTGDDVLDGGIDNDTLTGDEGNDTLIGGQGADVMFGGLGDDSFVIDEEGDGTDDVVVGGEDPDDSDNDVLDLTGANVASIVYTNDDPETESGVVTFADGGTLTFSEIETVIPCFTPGTFIATAKGERFVEELQPGDRVITRDNGFQEIAWVGAKQMSGLELAQRPNLKPVFVKAGSLGHGLPERDMMLSPNHKVLLASDEAELYFEEREVLVAAKHLIGKPGIQQVDVTQTTYIHFMFERHEVVLSDGAWTESFHPGDYSINGVDEDARNEIFALFPELATDQGLRNYRLARTELKKHEARLLIG